VHYFFLGFCGFVWLCGLWQAAVLAEF